jgi:hypothetical protein
MTDVPLIYMDFFQALKTFKEIPKDQNLSDTPEAWRHNQASSVSHWNKRLIYPAWGAAREDSAWPRDSVSGRLWKI